MLAAVPAPGSALFGNAREDVIEIAVEELTVSALIEVGFAYRPMKES
jgi:hypothetical protein